MKEEIIDHIMSSPEAAMILETLNQKWKEEQS